MGTIRWANIDRLFNEVSGVCTGLVRADRRGINRMGLK